MAGVPEDELHSSICRRLKPWHQIFKQRKPIGSSQWWFILINIILDWGGCQDFVDSLEHCQLLERQRYMRRNKCYRMCWNAQWVSCYARCKRTPRRQWLLWCMANVQGRFRGLRCTRHPGVLDTTKEGDLGVVKHAGPLYWRMEKSVTLERDRCQQENLPSVPYHMIFGSGLPGTVVRREPSQMSLLLIFRISWAPFFS